MTSKEQIIFDCSDALELLKKTYAKIPDSEIKVARRLKNILEKLERFSIGEYDNKKDLTPEEEAENEIETMCEYIINDWGNCENLRNKIENEETGYFYNSYTYVPVDWETYSSFVNSCDCWCRKCSSFSDESEEDEEESGEDEEESGEDEKESGEDEEESEEDEKESGEDEEESGEDDEEIEE